MTVITPTPADLSIVPSAAELAAAILVVKASGTHVVVPIVPTPAMAESGDRMMTALMRGQLPGFDPVWLRAWRALLEARWVGTLEPYASPEPSRTDPAP